MKRLIMVWLACAFIAVGGCTSMHAPSRIEQVKLWHIVIVRLNQPGDPEARRKLVEATRSFRQIKGVQVAYVGTVLPGSRPHIDSNFDVGIVMGFKTQDDMAAYANDPIHQKAVNDVLKPLAKDYTIYDFTNE